ncbi:MAG: ErfK/YbiS/YcfS/YnhG family protein [Thermoleophilia bacterium]|nr:ErfK/YbiS/YcfS/YnhG family protein [Thermoleophilia bacterium]
MTQRSRIRRTCAAALLTLAVAVGSASAADVGATVDEPVTPTPPPAGSCVHPDVADGPAVAYRWRSRVNAWRAHAVSTGTVARRFPDAKSVSVAKLGVTTLHSSQAAWYLILDARQIGDACWLQVRLPAPANNKAGWVLRDSVAAERVRWQIEVDLSDRRVRVYAGSVLKLNAAVVVGAPSTPTPRSPVGAPFAMYDAVAGKASDFSGTWQLATTATSPQVPSMGRVGLHGRGGASLRDALGTARSHGCVRLANSSVSALVRMVTLPRLFGVPVVVVA